MKIEVDHAYHLEGKTLMDIDAAITTLTDSIKPEIESTDALRYSQAALNLAHTKQVLQQAQREEAYALPK